MAATLKYSKRWMAMPPYPTETGVVDYRPDVTGGLAAANAHGDIPAIPAWEDSWEFYDMISTVIWLHSSNNDCLDPVTVSSNKSTAPPSQVDIEATFYTGPGMDPKNFQYTNHTCWSSITRQEFLSGLVLCTTQLHQQNQTAGCCYWAIPESPVGWWQLHVKLSTQPVVHASYRVKCLGWKNFPSTADP